jgi:hypothetical protein
MSTSSSYGPAAGFLLAVVLATISCADSPPASGAQATVLAAGPASGIQQIEQLIGDAACSNASECRVIGVGALACGGPEAYRAWSVTRTDARTLEEAVARDAGIRRKEIERAGMLSTCAVKPVPGVACARTPERIGAGRCVLTSAGGAS